MSKISFIFLVTIILLWSNNQAHQLNSNEFFSSLRPSKSLQAFALQKLDPIKDERTKGLLLSYVFGINSKISKEDRKTHRTLNLLHLFSPSGLHVSSILFIFLWMIRKKWKYAYFFWSLFITIFFSISLSLPGYYPLKRTLGFHLLSLGNEIYLKKKRLKLSSFQIFIVLMIIDFSVGTFKESNLSFTYSFLFWGIILSGTKFSHRFFYLGLAQFLVCYFSQTPINPLSILSNLFLSPIFSFLFPLIFFAVMLGYQTITEFLTSVYISILDFVADGISIMPVIHVDDLFIYILVFILIYREVKVPKKFFLVLCLISTPLSSTKINSFKEFKKSYIYKIKKPPEGGF
jgi:competence protein ComEC